MGIRSQFDIEVDERIRAWIRRTMRLSAEKRTPISQGAIGRKFGQSSGNMTKIMSGDYGFSAGDAVLIAKELGIGIYELLYTSPAEQFFVRGSEKPGFTPPKDRRRGSFELASLGDRQPREAKQKAAPQGTKDKVVLPGTKLAEVIQLF